MHSEANGKLQVLRIKGVEGHAVVGGVARIDSQGDAGQFVGIGVVERFGFALLGGVFEPV